MVGTIVSHYRILEKLGEGGMGVVYKAEDTKLRRTVALKFLAREGEELRQRLVAEAQAAAALHHPNICTVFEIDEDLSFLAMEFVEGETLASRIAARPLPCDEALEIAAQIGTGLQAAHEKGITHRDMKPANVMVARGNVAKIMDFGLARHSGRTLLTKDGTSVGTPAYMSPEQARGEPADRRADIWGLGVILYEMLSGLRPFRAGNEAALARAILDDAPEPLTALRSGLPIDLDRVIAKALAKKPAERYQNVDDFLVDLRRCRNGAERHVPVRPRSRRWLWGVGACAGIAVLAAGVWFGGFHRTWRNPLEGARYSRVTGFEGMELDASISPEGKLIAFLSDRDGPIDLWMTQVGTQNFANLTQGKMKNFPLLDDRPLGFNHDGSQIWFHQRRGPGEPWAMFLIPSIGGAPRPLMNAGSAAWSHEGRKMVYHTTEPGDPTFVAEPDGANASLLFRSEPGFHAHHPVWSPDGKFIYFTSGFPPDQLDVWRVPVGGGNRERITFHNSRVRTPALLADDTLVYSATADDGLGSILYVMNLADRIPRRATTGLEQYISVTADEAPAGRPRRLAATLVNPASELWSVPIAAASAQDASALRIATQNAQPQGPRLHGADLYYMAASGPAHALWKREGTNQPAELWKSSAGGLAGPPAISPDGKSICFSFRQQDKTRLQVMDADGTHVRTIASSFQVRGAASWSPDGKWVVVAGEEGRGNRVYKVPVDGGPAVRMLDSESAAPVWSPDGRMIVYSGPNVGGTRRLLAMAPDGKPETAPEISVRLKMDAYRFLPGGKSLVVLQGTPPRQAFLLVNLASGEKREITGLQPGPEIQGFDVSPDGQRVIFDRIRANADIVLIELAQN